MKKLLIPALLLAAASSYGQLTTATGTRLTDYTNWFGPFAVASDANYTGIPSPALGIPNATAIDTINRDWKGWKANWTPTALGAPITNTSTTKNLVVETLFLGESAGWWDDFGVRINGVDSLLADSVQTIGAGTNRSFGDYTYITLKPGQTLDFFVTGTGVFGNNPGITTGPNGGKYFAFETSANYPAASTQQSYWGQLEPLTSARGQAYVDAGQFTVLAFEDIRSGGAGRDSDFNDFLFAFRSGYDIPQGGVPEPSTYGLLGAAALLGLVGYRRFRKA